MQPAEQVYEFRLQQLRAVSQKKGKEKSLEGKNPQILLDFLSIRFPYLQISRWQELIELKRVQINHQPTFVDYKLADKDLISYHRIREEEPKVEKDFAVLYRDEHLLVVEKGGNLPVSYSGRYWFNTLLNFLAEDFGLPELYPVHRIDKETSGLVVVALTAEVANKLGKIIAGGGHNKYYHCLLTKELAEKEYWATAAIRKNFGASAVHIRQMAAEDGKAAKTRFDAIAREQGLTFCGVETFTGRTHQIRVHAEVLGAPILGDKLYGLNDEEFLANLKNQANPKHESFGEIPRHFLHASFLSFPHPITAQPMAFISNPWRFFDAALPLERLMPTQAFWIKQQTIVTLAKLQELGAKILG